MARLAAAQDVAPPAPRGEAATARHLLVGDVAIEMRSPMRGTLSLGLADGRHAVAIDVRATDARRWADSVLRLVARKSPPVRRPAGRRSARSAPDTSNGVQRAMAVLEEPGVGAGSLIITRVDSAATVRWSIYAADGDLAEVRQSLEPEEARVLARVVRQGAIAAAPRPLKAPRTPPRRAKPRSGARGATPATRPATR